MHRSSTQALAIAGVAVLAVSMSFVSPAFAANKALQAALGSLAAGGLTVAGPGTFVTTGPTTTTPIQVNQDSNLCVTVTLVAGDGVSATLRDGVAAGLQNVATSVNNRSVTGCADGTRTVDLTCTGALPCEAVWRVDKK